MILETKENHPGGQIIATIYQYFKDWIEDSSSRVVFFTVATDPMVPIGSNKEGKLPAVRKSPWPVARRRQQKQKEESTEKEDSIEKGKASEK